MIKYLILLSSIILQGFILNIINYLPTNNSLNISFIKQRRMKFEIYRTDRIIEVVPTCLQYDKWKFDLRVTILIYKSNDINNGNMDI
jgi:hypothetical protein